MTTFGPIQFPAQLIEHRPDPHPYVTIDVNRESMIWDAIARLDCDDFTALMVRQRTRADPTLTIAGCEQVGYLIHFDDGDRDLVALGDPLALGVIDIVFAGQEVDRPVRELCGAATLRTVLDEFLASQSPATTVTWEDPVESLKTANQRP